jgi:hypothetical protein
MLEKLVARIKELGAELEKSAAVHNAMLGAMQELKSLYQDALKVAPLVDVLVPESEPVIEGIEAVVSAAE